MISSCVGTRTVCADGACLQGCNHCELARIKVLNPPSTGSCETEKPLPTCSHNTDAVDVHGDPTPRRACLSN